MALLSQMHQNGSVPVGKRQFLHLAGSQWPPCRLLVERLARRTRCIFIDDTPCVEEMQLIFFSKSLENNRYHSLVDVASGLWGSYRYIPVYVIHFQSRPAGMLKTDKRDALMLANTLYNQLELGFKLTPRGSSSDASCHPLRRQLSSKGWSATATNWSAKERNSKTSSRPSATNFFQSRFAW